MLYLDTRLGGTERWSVGPPKGWGMRVPDEALKSVVFLVRGADPPSAAGTAFLVSVDSERIATRAYTYLVTAKHVLTKARQEGTALHVRLNTKSGGAAIVNVEDAWSESTDADVAVLRFRPPSHALVKPLPRAMFLDDATRTKQGIGIGEDIFLVGLFTRRQGRQRNLPIVRSGTIAAMPDEPIQSDSGGDVLAYLAEVHSTGGLSGSPVFVTLGLARPRWIDGGGSLSEEAMLRLDTGTRVYLLGLMYGGHSKEVPALDVSEDELRNLNLGIARVTPIEDVAALLDSDELRAARRAEERQSEARDAATPD